MARRRTSRVALISILLASGVMAQARVEKEPEGQTDKHEPATSSEILEENKYFKVLRVDLTESQTTKIDHLIRFTVIVVLVEGVTLSAGNSVEAERLKNGAVQFVALPSPAKVVNSDSSPVKILVVELKQHCESLVRTCAEPTKRTRPIVIGGSPIGETTTLFTNGFVTAYQHQLDQGKGH